MAVIKPTQEKMKNENEMLKEKGSGRVKSILQAIDSGFPGTKHSNLFIPQAFY